MAIPKSYKGADLVGRKVRPTHSIKNGGGCCVSPDTVCTIVSVVRGHGFTIKSEKCPYCGQSAYIARVHREDLDLVFEDK